MIGASNKARIKKITGEVVILFLLLFVSEQGEWIGM